MVMTLLDLQRGEEGVILRIGGDGRLRQRIAAMGFVSGTPVRMDRQALFGNPRIYEIRGYRISLRNEEAGKITLCEKECATEVCEVEECELKESELNESEVGGNESCGESSKA